jgi:hypothetical protein
MVILIILTTTKAIGITNLPIIMNTVEAGNRQLIVFVDL